MQHGYQCGMIWGATLAAGAQAYRIHGSGPQAETAAVVTAQKLVESFQARNHNINCGDITEIDKSSSTLQMIMYFLIKGGTIGCLRMAAKNAHAAYAEINSTLADNQIETPSPPVSCAAMLAAKMGLSDLHRMMVAGFAGGIGLCGGACGALGAAIWISGIKLHQERVVKNLWNDKVFNTGFEELVERFLKVTKYEFECADIVGRRFENVSDHAAFLGEGGCAEIIEVLAGTD